MPDEVILTEIKLWKTVQNIHKQCTVFCNPTDTTKNCQYPKNKFPGIPENSFFLSFLASFFCNSFNQILEKKMPCYLTTHLKTVSRVTENHLFKGWTLGQWLKL